MFPPQQLQRDVRPGYAKCDKPIQSRQALPLADRLYLTQVHQDAAGDTKFPPYDPRDWQETQRAEDPGCLFLDYVRQR